MVNVLPKENEKRALAPKDVIDNYPALAKSKGVLANWRNQKRGPAYFKIGRRVVYRPEDIENFLFQNPALTIDSGSKYSNYHRCIYRF